MAFDTSDYELREKLATGCRVLAMEGHDDLIWGHMSVRDPNNPNQGFVPSRWDKKNPNWDGQDTTKQYLTDANGKRIKEPVGQIMGVFDTIRYTVTTPTEVGKLWKYLIYREPYAPLGSTDMSVWVRKDVVSLYHGLEDLPGVPNYDYISK